MRCFVNEVLRTILHPSLLKLQRLDYYEGQVLSNSLSTPFNHSESIRFMVNLMDILQYLECEGIVHRDIKPANIVLTNPKDRSELKLIDWLRDAKARSCAIPQGHQGTSHLRYYGSGVTGLRQIFTLLELCFIH